MEENNVYNNAPDKKQLSGGPSIAVGDLFIYMPDVKLTPSENLKIIVENIQYLLRDRQDNDFVIKVELMSSVIEKQACMEITNSLKAATEEALNLHKSELVPVGVDKDGKTSFQRREDIKQED